MTSAGVIAIEATARIGSGQSQDFTVSLYPRRTAAFGRSAEAIVHRAAPPGAKRRMVLMAPEFVASTA
jgi:hypothetical protein